MGGDLTWGLRDGLVGRSEQAGPAGPGTDELPRARNEIHHDPADDEGAADTRAKMIVDPATRLNRVIRAASPGG